MASGDIEVKRALSLILERYAAANRRAQEVQWDADAELATRAQAAAELDSIATEYFCLSHELGETLICLLRHALDKQPDLLRGLLMKLLAPDIALLVKDALKPRNGHAR